MTQHKVMARLAMAALATVAMVAPLGACKNPGTASSSQTTISFYSYFKDNQIGSVVKDFEKKNPDIKVDIQYGQDSTQYIQTLQTRLAGGQPPTIFNLTMDNRTDIMSAGQALDLTGGDFLKGIDDSNFTLFKQDDKIYGMPVAAWVGAVFFNKDILKAAGYDTIPATWDEFVEMGKKINSMGKTAFLEDFNTQPSGTFEALLASYYASQKNPVQDEVIFSGKSTFEAEWTKPLEEWKKAIDAGVIPTKSVGLNADQVKQEFLTGNLAVMRSGPWDLKDIRESGVKFGVAPMPSYMKGEQWINGGPDQGFAIAAKAPKEQQEAAKKFLAFLNSEEGLKSFTTAAGNTSLSKNFRNDPPEELKEVFDKYFTDNKFYWVNFAKGPAVMMTEMAAQQQMLVQGKTTPADFAKAMDAKWAEVNKK